MKNKCIYYFIYLCKNPILSDIDECDSNPCQNDGQCVDGVNSYTCECTSGYSGDNCDTSEYLFEERNTVT